RDINLTIQPGDFVGISGCSGSGKTTILNLFLGFLTPRSGMISINEKSSDPSAIQEYWEHISYVRQQPFLIHDSIRRNIILDNPYDEARLEEVIQIAGLQELMNIFPETHEKIIMENGKNLSGGQRQRIAIARALYKNAKVILLDEPFNELDEATELGFLSHFKSLAQDGKMIILITHNKSSFSYCNKMISLDEHTS
ncbi:MAG TPA: ATP-binding cassette domain-containing protein, partial [Flavitalea sp.]|nr:ATP-binding cassette domain-containing protein [Flavitalea sp.]